MVPPRVGEVPHGGLLLLPPRHRGLARVEGEVNMPEGIPISIDKKCSLRLKGEVEPEIAEEGADLERRLPEDVFPEDEESEEIEARKLLPPSRGLWIAAATFVPTFLAVFFGVPYLLGGATYIHTAGTHPPGPVVVSAPLTPQPDATVAPPLPEAARGGTTDGRIGFPAQPPASDLSATPERAPVPPPAESNREAKAEDPEAAEPSVAGPSLPPAEARVPAPLRRGPTTRVTGPGDWKPAAAFADREAAGRLAASMKRQGYPVEIRLDLSSTRPWVVWIAAQPHSGERRR